MNYRRVFGCEYVEYVMGSRALTAPTRAHYSSRELPITERVR